MNLIRHIPFLKNVLALSLTAFGGPQGHMVMMKKLFVEKRRDITEEELLDFNAFTQLLPGPSSSQTVMLVGMKRGGVLLGILTMLIWILPATIFMGIFSFIVYHYSLKNVRFLEIFEFLKPMSIGFVAYTAWLYTKNYCRNKATLVIAILTIPIFILYINPLVFPLLIMAGGFATNLSSKRYPDTDKIKRKKIHWNSFGIFLLIFFALVTLATMAIKFHWLPRLAYTLPENFYRFGSIVFGGGQVLLPMMLYQFVERPLKMHLQPMISSSELLMGYGFVNSLPGPVYSLCGYVGGIMLAPQGWQYQILGIIIGSIFIFLPGVLLIIFLFPIYQNLKYHVVIFRALEGIKAVISGILWASVFILWNKSIFHFYSFNIILIIATFLILNFTKIMPQYIVVFCILIGVIFRLLI